MAVYLSVAPPDGFEAWTADEWDAWLVANPWEPATVVTVRGDWLIFLFQVKQHAPRAAGELAIFWERLMNERSVASTGVRRLREGLRAAAKELADVPSTRLWTGTVFYSLDELGRLVNAAEVRVGRIGADLSVADLWGPVFDRLDDVLARALDAGRGIYFGNV